MHDDIPVERKDVDVGSYNWVLLCYAIYDNDA
jgi:hypothetical protein